MTTEEIMAAIEKMELRDAGKEQVPPPELVAFFVRLVRGLRNWKQRTLASFAGVSLSTVERAERAEGVSVESLDRIAVALGYGAGYLTAPRAALSAKDTIQKMVETWGHLVVVPVQRLSRESAFRKLGGCHACLIHRPQVDPKHDELIAALGEWLEAASWISSDTCVAEMSEGRKRAFYAGAIECVRSLKQRKLTVLCGVMSAPQPRIPEWQVGVVSISPTAIDPGAPKRRHLLVDVRNAEPTDIWADGGSAFKSSFRTAVAKVSLQ
ncbi:MAG TPA: helix-turn-helix domain-containing protein [Stellaceae bacterium]|nr:helix-turn-helix domain-containing protein [Stellaceae bacterium]